MIPRIAPPYYFRLENGKVIKSLQELPRAIDALDREIFHRHVTPHKNDFAAWVYGVYRMEDLARELGQAKSKEECRRVVQAYLHKLRKVPHSSLQPSLDTPDRVRESRSTIQEQKEPAEPIIKAAAQETVSQQQEQPKKEPKRDEIKENAADETPATRQTTPRKPAQESGSGQQQEKKPVDTKKYAWHGNEKKEQPVREITDADEFFLENPLLIEQIVEGKKRGLKIEPLRRVDVDESAEPQKLADVFKDAYSNAYRRLTFLRKHGFDTSLAEMMLFRIPTKIKVFETTKDKEDAKIVQRYLNEIIEELNNLR